MEDPRGLDLSQHLELNDRLMSANGMARLLGSDRDRESSEEDTTAKRRVVDVSRSAIESRA
jgi:hypothetical protein